MSTIKGFRLVIGPDGEETYEFASESEQEEENSASDEDYVVPTSSALLARRNAIPNLEGGASASLVDVATVAGLWTPETAAASHINPLNPPEQQQQQQQQPPQNFLPQHQISSSNLTIREPQVVTEEEAELAIPIPPLIPASQRLLEVQDEVNVEYVVQDEDNDSFYEDLSDTNSNNMAGPSRISISTIIPAAMTVGVRKPRRRRKGRAPKKYKSKVVRVPKPPKPLAPVVLPRNVECRGKITNLKTFHLLPIKINPTPTYNSQRVHAEEDGDGENESSIISNNENDNDVTAQNNSANSKTKNIKKNKNNPNDSKAYKLSSFELILLGSAEVGHHSSEANDSHVDAEQIASLVREAKSIEIFFTRLSDVCNSRVLFKKEVLLSDEESARIPFPNAATKAKYKHRKVNYLNVEHYYYDCEVRTDMDLHLLDGLRSKKSFRLDLASYSMEDRSLTINVMLLESVVIGDHDLNSMPSVIISTKHLLNHFFKVKSVEKIENQEKEDIEWFYGQVQKYHRNETLPTPTFSLQHPSMNPVLRDYQKKAVQWMLFREKAIGYENEQNQDEGQVKAIDASAQIIDIQNLFLKQMFTQVKLSYYKEEDQVDEFGGRIVVEREKEAFYNSYVGYVCWSRCAIPPQTGGAGIIADEMGLGKTVEVLSLILLNPRPMSNTANSMQSIEYNPEACEKEEFKGEEEDGDDNEESDKYSSSGTEEDDSEDSDFSLNIPVKGRKRTKRLSNRGSKRKVSKRCLEDSDDDDDDDDQVTNNETVTHPHHPRFLRKRAASPCEFEARNFDDDDKGGVNNVEEGEVFSAKRKRTARIIQSSDEEDNDNDNDNFIGDEEQSVKNEGTNDSSVEDDNADADKSMMEEEHNVDQDEDEDDEELEIETVQAKPKRKRGRKPRLTTTKKAGQKKAKATTKKKGGRKAMNINDFKKGAGKKGTLYENLKVRYEQELSSYSASNSHNPRFHGEFFETTIRRKAYFECLCGDGIEDLRDVITCSNCSSSQHASCVMFDMKRSKKERLAYLCPNCEVKMPPIEASTTLIITPSTISYQWINEIQRHVKNQHIKILFYKGVSQHGYISPSKLASYDLVITTYSVLSTELNYCNLHVANSEDGRKFRNAKRFMTVSSSLPAVSWWRVCLDEAQMIEGSTSKMASMALQLHSVHRWCISGTPLNKGLQDLYGLMAFLDIAPISYEYWWEYLVKIPFCKKDTSLLFELFGQTMWRTNKTSVLDQLGIPPQSQIIHWLNFSPVETHFYKRQYESSASNIRQRIVSLKQSSGSSILQARLSALDRRQLQSLLQPFLELRQACCHPNVASNKSRIISLHKGALTMEQLLAQLIKKTTIQCQEDHRLVVSALNGIAGLHILQDNWSLAAEKYREILQLADKYKSYFTTDALQLLHALENMADVIDHTQYQGVPPTLRDDSLRSEATELRKKYLEKYSTSVGEARRVVGRVTDCVTELMENFKCTKASWWVSVLRRAAQVKKDEDLVSRIKDDFTFKAKIWKSKTLQKSSIAHKFHDTFGLEQVLIEKIMELEENRDSVLHSLEELLNNEDASSFVSSAVNCHLRGQTQSYYSESGSNAYRCELCSNHDLFLSYETLLFSLVENEKIRRTGRNRQLHNFAGTSGLEDLTSEEKALILMREEEELIETTEHINVNMIQDQRRQTWADSEVEKVIKLLLSFAKMNGCSVTVIDDGMNHVKLFENLRKEFRLMRVLWRQFFDQVSAIDELSQATTRLKLGIPDYLENKANVNKSKKALSSGISEKADKIANIHVLERHEVEPKLEQMQSDYETGKEYLLVHYGQLLYLQTLEKNGYGKKGSLNTEDCPICANMLGHSWCVLVCGHSFCSECVRSLCGADPNATTGNRQQNFQCPLCRRTMKTDSVSYIDTKIGPDDEDETAESATNPNEPSTSKQGTTTAVANSRIEIKGSHSTKVEAIVRTLLKLQDSHPGEKALIFSSWTEVLDIISKALDENDIKYCELATSQKNKFHLTIDRFKKREDIQALLINLQSGSKGLNLIEATHVLLVEPVFNIASELQAIGRVHRIGQTKPTFVHRFYVKKTIEDQLYEILKSHDVSSDDEGFLTVADLQSLVSDLSCHGEGGGYRLGSAAAPMSVQ